MSLWGEEFELKEIPKQKIINKINNPKKLNISIEKTVNSKSISIIDKLPIIYREVFRILGKYKDNTICIRDKQSLIDYFDKAIDNGVIAIDTETNNSLDPITCLLMGACIYTPGMKNAYIPMHHTDLNGNLLSNQLTEVDFKEQLDRLSDVKIIMHNGKFDYEVIKCTCNKELYVYWDTMIAAKILDENERRAGLKYQYIDKIDSNQEKYDIEHLFSGITYAVVDPDVFALYAATDAYMTYELYKWQCMQFEKPENKALFNLFLTVEMPVVQVIAEMELTGICIDFDYAKRLSDKYHNQLNIIDNNINEELHKYKDKIAAWRCTEEANYKPLSTKPNKYGEYKVQKSKNEQLLDPPELNSTTQLAILLYDILHVPVIDKKSPRGTGEDILNKIDIPLCKLILEKRAINKLIDTYIDKIPMCVNIKDNRIHANFNQLGAKTGRLSSSDPNLQNIPSHNKEIRLIFTAAPGNTLVGADFSQQEPRLLSQYSQDDVMINAYKQGKDLYATIAMGIYKNGYWDNMEKFKDGTPNPDGKKRRSNCKTLLLGIMYGIGSASIAEQIGSSIQEAQKIIDDFYSTFPKVKTWIIKTEEDAKLNGYVEDLWGRRRRLPDIQLPKYTLNYISDNIVFNPILHSKGIFNNNQLLDKYNTLIYNQKTRQQINSIKNKAAQDGILITDNGAFIAKAERQCVNARVQGGAASMSKIAMKKVFDSVELKNLGFKIVLQIHDELIGECPIENAEKARDILTDIMSHCVESVVQVPFKCDGDISPSWYYNDFKDEIQKEYNTKLDSGMDVTQALNYIQQQHTELTCEQLHEFLN